MKYHSLGLALSLLLPAALPAQDRPAIEAFGGAEPDERGSTRVLYWDRQKDLGAGEFAIDYGRPVWKKDYEDLAKFDGMTKGKTWRLGKDFWNWKFVLAWLAWQFSSPFSAAAPAAIALISKQTRRGCSSMPG